MKSVCWPLNKGLNTTAVTNFKQPVAQSGACVSVGGRNNVPIKTNLEPSLLSRLPGSKLTTPNQALMLTSSQPRQSGCSQPSRSPVWDKDQAKTKTLFIPRPQYLCDFHSFDMIFPWRRAVTKGHRHFLPLDASYITWLDVTSCSHQGPPVSNASS